MGKVTLWLGTEKKRHKVDNAQDLLKSFWTENGGRHYYEHEPTTSKDHVVVEDLGVTLLLNSRAGSVAAEAIRKNAKDLHGLAATPSIPLAKLDDEQLNTLVELIVTVVHWPGIGASIATKLLHKKRPATIPVLDNQAIFGAYMNPRWPETLSRRDTVKSADRIRAALVAIRQDLERQENKPGWRELKAVVPKRSDIEIFDMVWWMYFRKKEPAPDKVASRGRP